MNNVKDLVIQIKVMSSFGDILYKKNARLEDKARLNKLFSEIKEKFNIKMTDSEWEDKIKAIRDKDKAFYDKVREKIGSGKEKP